MCVRACVLGVCRCTQHKVDERTAWQKSLYQCVNVVCISFNSMNCSAAEGTQPSTLFLYRYQFCILSMPMRRRRWWWDSVIQCVAMLKKYRMSRYKSEKNLQLIFSFVYEFQQSNCWCSASIDCYACCCCFVFVLFVFHCNYVRCEWARMFWIMLFLDDAKKELYSSNRPIIFRWIEPQPKEN